MDKRKVFEYQKKYGMLDDYTEQEINQLMREYGLDPHEYDEEIDLMEKCLRDKRSSTTPDKNRTIDRRKPRRTLSRY